MPWERKWKKGLSLSLVKMEVTFESIRRGLAKNRYPGLFEADVLEALKHYPTLLPSQDRFVHNDGKEVELFNLRGTIPVLIRGVTYNIPVQLWLQERHPYVPPLVFVTPTSTMAIKPSPHVDTSGKVYLPYLHEWEHSSQVCLLTNIHFFLCDKSDLSTLLETLCGVFSLQSPVFKRMPDTMTQSQQIGNLLNYPILRRAPTTEENIVSQRRLMTAEQQLGVESEELGQQRTHFQAQLLEKEAEITNLRKEKAERGTMTQWQQFGNLLNYPIPRRAPTTEENIVLQRRLMTAEQQLRVKSEELGQQRTHFQAQLLEKEAEITNLRREKAVQRQLREMSQQLADVQGQLQQRDREANNLQNQVTALERQLRIKDQEVNELEISLSTTQQVLNENPRQQAPEWIISRDQIQLTDKCLGRGAWGSVVEGKYRGCVVAVKQIHEMILSPHNRRLFEREMNIASRCRHPCLLQFIGATNDEGSPLFVSELMESSLRALLEQQSLSSTEVSVISLDVALALNYLHLKEPSPIIHRDISSANVLLWRQANRWRGKLSDYGTANFMQQTMTVGPGAMIYSAPEAHTKSQTVKVDVYSFGVLLCEICIRELPDPDRRDQQVAMVTDRTLRGLIRRCIHQDPEARPSMEDIIEELEQLV
nr:uncharacterized protein LOC131782187 [Pocillopora verrucosa]